MHNKKSENKVPAKHKVPLEHAHVKTITAYLILLVLALTCISALAFMSPSFIGYVTFSESVVSAEPETISMASSGKVQIKTDLDNINSIMLSGKLFGIGTAAVFLEKDGKDYLAYYFKGDASDTITFTNMCYDTCHIEDLPKLNTLRFELDNMMIDINNIKYTYSRIIDFELQPRTIEINYKTDPAKIITLTLTNNELTDYKVLLYIDGPLSSSFSWQGSLVHMTKDMPEKNISMTVKLPSNLPEGEYPHKVTARYIPPDTYDFIGESPVAESFITVVN
jgi:hypothetical protein